MWLDKERIRFDEKEKIKFFRELRQKSKMNFIGLAEEAKIPIGRFGLYRNTNRSLPKSLFNFWAAKYSIETSNYNIKVLDSKEIMSGSGRKGQEKLQAKYGRKWLVELGKQRMKNLQRDFQKNPKLRRKWKQSVKDSLVKKYGQDCYHRMGLLGGRHAIEMADKDELHSRLKKAFRKSFKSKIIFDGRRFRSRKEVEVAKFLVLRSMPYEYEKELMGFYPDFILPNKIIIEVVGMDWKPHIERTLNKISIFSAAGFNVVVYTYPNMTKFFDKTNAKVLTNIEDLDNFLGYNRG